jgi:hypothetical protein
VIRMRREYVGVSFERVGEGWSESGVLGLVGWDRMRQDDLYIPRYGYDKSI